MQVLALPSFFKKLKKFDNMEAKSNFKGDHTCKGLAYIKEEGTSIKAPNLSKK